MSTSSTSARAARERLTVDLCGMRLALVRRAEVRGVTLSVLVRDALAAEASSGDEPASATPAELRQPRRRVRLSLRLGAGDGRELVAAARASGLSLGSYVVALMATRSAVPSSRDRSGQLAALTRSNAELATLSRNIAHLTTLLRHGAVRAALEYREMLDTLDGDIRAHLAMAAAILSEPALGGRRPSSRSKHG